MEKFKFKLCHISHQGSKGTVVNRALPSLHGWRLEITLTVLTFNPCFTQRHSRESLVSPLFCYLKIDTSISILIKYSEELIQKLFSRLTLNAWTYEKYCFNAVLVLFIVSFVFVLQNILFVQKPEFRIKSDLLCCESQNQTLISILCRSTDISNSRGSHILQGSRV